MWHLLEWEDLPESGGCVRWQQCIQHTQNSLLLLLAGAALHDLLGQLYKAIITWLIWNAYKSQQLQAFLCLVAGWSMQIMLGCKRPQLETHVAGVHTSKLLRHLFGEVSSEKAVHKIVIVCFELRKGVL